MTTDDDNRPEGDAAATATAVTAPEQAPAGAGGGKRVAGALGTLLVVASKFKSLFFVALKFLQYTKTIWSMALMVWAYSVNLGWPYAAGFVALILVHELGHGYAGKRLGYGMSSPVFIPFIGAFIALKDKPRTAFHDFVIGAGGPVAGTLGALACLGVSRALRELGDGYYGARLFFAIGYSALVLNLFNLMPIGFLDGGRMSKPISKLAWVVGYAALCAGFWYVVTDFDFVPNGVAVLVLLIGLVQLVLKLFAKRPAPVATAADGGAVHPEGEGGLVAAVVYFGLAAGLIFLVHWLQPS